MRGSLLLSDRTTCLLVLRDNKQRSQLPLGHEGVDFGCSVFKWFPNFDLPLSGFLHFVRKILSGLCLDTTLKDNEGCGSLKLGVGG